MGRLLHEAEVEQRRAGPSLGHVGPTLPMASLAHVHVRLQVVHVWIWADLLECEPSLRMNRRRRVDPRVCSQIKILLPSSPLLPEEPSSLRSFLTSSYWRRRSAVTVETEPDAEVPSLPAEEVPGQGACRWRGGQDVAELNRE